MARPKVGDIIEIVTKDGLVYAQYTHEHDSPPRYGSLLRVFEGVFDERPADFSWIEVARVNLCKFFPLSISLRKELVSVVATRPVPAALQSFPTFRSGIPNPATRKVEDWWLWDGQDEWRLGRPLTMAERRYPVSGVCNLDMLRHIIETGQDPLDPQGKNCSE